MRPAHAAVWFTAVAVITYVSAAVAQQSTADYKKGDKVEVRDGFNWKSATVIGVDRVTGWIEARLDDADLPSRIPERFRERMLTRSFPADSIRTRGDSEAAEDVQPDPAQAAPARTWTDRTGKFSVEARFDGLNGPTVALLRADGKRIEVPLEKLSEQDARYVREMTEASENPFGDPPAATTSATTSVAAPSRKANWRDVKSVRPQSFTQWTFAPQAADAKTLLKLAGAADVELALKGIPGSEKFFESVDGLYISSDGSRGIVCRTKGEVGQDKQQYLEHVDFEKGRSSGLVPLPSETAVLDVEPDSGLVMYRPDGFEFGEKRALTIARLEANRLTPVARWEPYSHEDWEPKRDIDSGWFLSGERIMTINQHGQALTVWNLDSPKALTNVPVRSSIMLKTALSPDRTLLAVVMNEGVAVIDLMAGRHAATVTTEGRRLSEVALRGDNARLAALSDQGVAVWDLTSGKLLQEFYSTVMGSGGGLKWAGEFLLVQNRYLFDIERRILLWEYQDSPGSGMAAAMRDGRLWVVPKVTQEGETVLVSAALPHAGAIELAETLPPAEELLVVKPGDSVAIEIDIDPGIDLADEIRKSLTAEARAADVPAVENLNVVVINPDGAQQDVIRRPLAAALQAAGLRVVEQSDLVVKAVCKPQSQQTIRINVDGRWPIRSEDIVERTITPHATYLQMTLHGELLWKRGFVATPGAIIFVKRGESLDEALTRVTQPNIRLFTNATFSPYVARPGTASPNGAYGISQFTTQGIIDGQSSHGDRVAFE